MPLSTEALLQEVGAVFPPVPKPQGLALSFHQSGCPHCMYLRSDIEQYSSPTLPPEAIRWLHGEMSCLSAQGWRWVLPSYLQVCLTQDPGYDPKETEFLIYNLSPSAEDSNDTRTRLAALNNAQLACLLHFLEWCGAHPHWSDWCPEDISAAIVFVQSVIEGANAA